MKQLLYISVVAVICFTFSLGFQCGSPELTSAKLYLQQKNPEKVIEACEKEVKNNPKSVEGWFLLGTLRGEKKDYKGMVDAYNACLACDPVTHKKEIDERFRYYWAQSFNSGVANFNKARKDNNAEFFKKAISDFKDAIMIFPDSIGTYWNLASCYVNSGQTEEAVKTYSFIAEKKNDLNAYLKLGDVFVEKGNEHKIKFDAENKDKVELLSKFEAVEKKVSRETVRKYLGEPTEIKNPQTTIVAPKKPKKKGQEEPKEEWIYSKYNLHIFFDKDLVAEKKFDPPYEIKIDSTEYANASAEWDKAIIWYTKAKDLASDSVKFNILEALTKLYTSTNKLDIAIKSYQELVDKDPKNKNYHYVLGILYLNNKRFEDATARFKKVIELDPNDDKSLYNLFAVYNNWAIKMRDEANNSGKEDTTYLSVLRQGLPFIEKLNELKPDALDYVDPLRSLYGIFQMKPELEKLVTRLKGMEVNNQNNPQYWDIMFKIYMNLNKQTEAIKADDRAKQLRKQN